jgi:hypothetical protein
MLVELLRNHASQIVFVLVAYRLPYLVVGAQMERRAP